MTSVTIWKEGNESKRKQKTWILEIRVLFPSVDASFPDRVMRAPSTSRARVPWVSLPFVPAYLEPTNPNSNPFSFPYSTRETRVSLSLSNPRSESLVIFRFEPEVNSFLRSLSNPRESGLYFAFEPESGGANGCPTLVLVLPRNDTGGRFFFPFRSLCTRSFEKRNEEDGSGAQRFPSREPRMVHRFRKKLESDSKNLLLPPFSLSFSWNGWKGLRTFDFVCLNSSDGRFCFTRAFWFWKQGVVVFGEPSQHWMRYMEGALRGTSFEERQSTDERRENELGME